MAKKGRSSTKQHRSTSARELATKIIKRNERRKAGCMDPHELVDALVDARVEYLDSVPDEEVVMLAESALDEMNDND